MMSSKQLLQMLWAQFGRHLGSLKYSKQTGQDNSSSSASLNREDDIENIFLSFSLINGHEIAPFSPPFKSKYTNKILTEVSSSNEPCNLRNFALKCQKNIRYWLSAGKNFFGDHFLGELGNHAQLGSRAF